MATTESFSVHSDAVRAAAKARVTALLGGLLYEHDRARALVKAVADAVLEDARSIAGPRWKVIVNAAIVQTDAGVGGGLCTHSAVYWDPSQDGAIFCSFQTEHMAAVLTIYGASV